MDIEISFRGSGTVSIHTEEGETAEDINKLSDAKIVERIDFRDILNLIDEDDVEVDDIVGLKYG